MSMKEVRKRKLATGVLLLASIFLGLLQLTCTSTSALTLQQATTSTVMNDVQRFNATFPWLFNPNYTYTEFASVDLATVTRPSGNFTFNDIRVDYSFVYDNNGIAWSLMQGKNNAQILILMAYSSSIAPTPHHLGLDTSVTVVARMNAGFAHAYLILMQPKA